MPEKDIPTPASCSAGSATAGGAGPAPQAGSATGPVTTQPPAGNHGDQPNHGDSATVVELRRQVAELDDRWRRALADLDNLHKRYARDSEQQHWQERAQVAAAWLPVVDNLELALAHAAADPGAIVEGVRAVRDQALTVLAGLGFPPRDDVGAVFDPVRHEAIAATPDPQAPPGTVIQVVRPGYGDGERQLRPAAVVVAATPATDPAPATDASGASGGVGGDRRDAGAR